MIDHINLLEVSSRHEEGEAISTSSGNYLISYTNFFFYIFIFLLIFNFLLFNDWDWKLLFLTFNLTTFNLNHSLLLHQVQYLSQSTNSSNYHSIKYKGTCQTVKGNEVMVTTNRLKETMKPHYSQHIWQRRCNQELTLRIGNKHA